VSRQDKITKLCRAIKAYRGIAHGFDKENKVIWSIPPKKAEQKRVIGWLDRLGIDPEEIAFIDGLKTEADFRSWVETIR